MTLRPLIEWLGLKDDGTVDREVRLARAETARAALRILEGQESVPSVDKLLRQYETRIRLGERRCPMGRPQAAVRAYAICSAGRSRPTASAGGPAARSVIGDDAFHAAEEEIDLLELAADERIRPQA